MAYTPNQISSYISNLQAGGGTNADIAAAMNQYGVSPAEVAAAENMPTATVQSLYNAVSPTGTFVTPSGGLGALQSGPTTTGSDPIANQPTPQAIQSTTPAVPVDPLKFDPSLTSQLTNAYTQAQQTGNYGALQNLINQNNITESQAAHNFQNLDFSKFNPDSEGNSPLNFAIPYATSVPGRSGTTSVQMTNANVDVRNNQHYNDLVNSSGMGKLNVVSTPNEDGGTDTMLVNSLTGQKYGLGSPLQVDPKSGLAVYQTQIPNPSSEGTISVAVVADPKTGKVVPIDPKTMMAYTPGAGGGFLGQSGLGNLLKMALPILASSFLTPAIGELLGGIGGVAGADAAAAGTLGSGTLTNALANAASTGLLDAVTGQNPSNILTSGLGSLATGALPSGGLTSSPTLNAALASGAKTALSDVLSGQNTSNILPAVLGGAAGSAAGQTADLGKLGNQLAANVAGNATTAALQGQDPLWAAINSAVSTGAGTVGKQAGNALANSLTAENTPAGGLAQLAAADTGTMSDVTAPTTGALPASKNNLSLPPGVPSDSVPTTDMNGDPAFGSPSTGTLYDQAGNPLPGMYLSVSNQEGAAGPLGGDLTGNAATPEISSPSQENAPSTAQPQGGLPSHPENVPANFELTASGNWADPTNQNPTLYSPTGQVIGSIGDSGTVSVTLPSNNVPEISPISVTLPHQDTTPQLEPISVTLPSNVTQPEITTSPTGTTTYYGPGTTETPSTPSTPTVSTPSTPTVYTPSAPVTKPTSTVTSGIPSTIEQPGGGKIPGYLAGTEIGTGAAQPVKNILGALTQLKKELADSGLSALEPALLKHLIKHKATGGTIHESGHPEAAPGEPIFRTGGPSNYVRGKGDGQSDDIPAMLADGEYVLDAELVSQLGDGSNKAGAEKLDRFREAIRRHKRSAPDNKIPPKAKKLTSYLKEAERG